MTNPDVPSVPIDAVPAEFDTAEARGSGVSAPAQLLDVREDDEWQLGRAPGALHIPMTEVPARLDELDIDAEIYVVCRQGGRSIVVVEYLNQIGYDAVNVSGGMVAWQQTGRPLTGDGPEAKIY
ncbi:rhodanese-like domain-containing protein [Nocardia yunnanensis]|uniref:Rhodanese-like domain-containing protein n=1 Tax=Nocardia yunnanensis TaxID=2382165 RepID=A0A386ZC32_9NOCA|nr:rhodanese-like domain-containing protein [Nocardia yunnanensis]AYF74723.1 rhodanese-like domain-containing protein [Nocardia yunnanensis]